MRVQLKKPIEGTLAHYGEFTESFTMRDETIRKINEYIFKNCTCDGMGPMDGHSDSGNFEGLSKEDFQHIVEIANGETK